MKIPKKILERRRSVRIQETLSFKIGHERYDIEAKTLNISNQGALCFVPQDIPLMTQLRIALTVPGSQPASRSRRIQAKGVVVRKEKDETSGKYLIAVYFSDMKESSRKALGRFIEQRLFSKSRP